MTLKESLQYRLEIYFGDVFPPFLPYLALYIIGACTNTPSEWLRFSFLFLHLLNLSALTYYIYLCRSFRFELTGILLLFFLFWIPGAYLEFPSDTWEHFRRLLDWNQHEYLRDSPGLSKFAYFWGWTFLKDLRPSSSLIFLNIYSALWQTLLAIQFYRLGRGLGLSKRASTLALIGTICLMGSNVFSFFRYYAISSTPLAHIAYLGGLISYLRGQRSLFRFVSISVLILLNHRQEFVFLIASISLIELNKRSHRATIVLLVGGVVVGLALACFHPLSTFVSHHEGFFTSWGFPRIWRFSHPFTETMGLIGLASVALAIPLRSKYPQVFILTVAPLIVLMSPIVVWVIAGVSDPYTSYRMLFTFSPAFALVFFGETYLFRSNPTKRTVALLILFIIYGLLPWRPFRGRLWFLLYQPAEELQLTKVVPDIERLQDQIGSDIRCLLVADEVTDFLLGTFYQKRLRWTSRPLASPPDRELPTIMQFPSRLSEFKWCGLIAPKAKIQDIPNSAVGRLSGHWWPQTLRLNFQAPENFGDLQNYVRTTLDWVDISNPFFDVQIKNDGSGDATARK